MNLKKGLIITFVSIFVIGICFLGYGFFGVSTSESRDIGLWIELQEKHTFLPSVDEASEYDGLKFKYFHKKASLFESDAYTLKVSYSESEFKKQKENIENKYVFEENVIEYGEKKVERKASFEHDGFKFRMLSEDEYELLYPKCIAFVGISEENKEIAFVFFDDIELDFIGTSFQEFLDDECGWE